MTIPDPRGKYSFESAAGAPTLPDVSQSGFILGCTESGTASQPRPVGNPRTMRSRFGEAVMTRIVEGHFVDDDNKRPLLAAKVPTTTAGVLHLDTSGVTGNSAITADGTVKPLIELGGAGDDNPIGILVLTGGDIGVSGICLRLTIDGFQTYIDVALGVATSITFPLGGIKVGFGSGTLVANDLITGWSEAPRWDIDDLKTAAIAINPTQYRISLICISEYVVPTDGTKLSEILDELRDPGGNFPHMIATKRRRYHDTANVTITATFDLSSRTLVRASGSFITDGFKPGMAITTAGAVNGGNDGTFERIETVAADTLTMTTGVTFVDEIATAAVTVLGQETEDLYAENSVTEWAAFEDERVSFTKYQVRAASPIDNAQLDEQLHGSLFSRCVAEPIESEPGQRRRVGTVGGRVSPKRGGRIHQDSIQVLPDMRLDGAGVVAPSRDIAVESAPDKRSGCFFVQCRTQGGTNDQIETIVMGRLVGEWESIVLTLEVDETLSAFPSEPGNPSKLSELAAQRLENLALAALRARLKGKVSNLDDIGDEQLFRVDRSSDLSAGGVSVTGFIRTLFYAREFTNTIKVRRPGQVS